MYVARTTFGRFPVYQTDASTILARTSGFIAQAGFTHSLTPARNCTFGCLYCYVPTLHHFGGLSRQDWTQWGRHTTFKANAAELLARELRPAQRIYCSPLVDPYQPAEETECSMPAILDALIRTPPRVFAIQTRGSLILRDLARLRALSAVTILRISFSLTTDSDDVRRCYEPRCSPIPERLQTMRALRDAGIDVYATLAPILPCTPERLAALALEHTDLDVVGDPLHVRGNKPAGAVTFASAARLSTRRSEEQWHDPSFQLQVVQGIRATIERAGRRFVIGPPGFGMLSRDRHTTDSRELALAVGRAPGMG